MRRPQSSTLFSYTTLFRSRHPIMTRKIVRMIRVLRVFMVSGLVGTALVAVRVLRKFLFDTSLQQTYIRAARGQPQGLSLRRSEEHTSELQSRLHLVCRLLL